MRLCTLTVEEVEQADEPDTADSLDGNRESESGDGQQPEGTEENGASGNGQIKPSNEANKYGDVFGKASDFIATVAPWSLSGSGNCLVTNFMS